VKGEIILLLKSMLIWISIIPLAILNGGLRQRILEPLFGGKIANPISGLILCILIFIVSLIFIPQLGNGNIRIYLTMGIIIVLFLLVLLNISSQEHKMVSLKKLIQH
jgi:lipopolysaccharide export LptBFGC system permease protein LptF